MNRYQIFIYGKQTLFSNGNVINYSLIFKRTFVELGKKFWCLSPFPYCRDLRE